MNDTCQLLFFSKIGDFQLYLEPKSPNFSTRFVDRQKCTFVMKNATNGAHIFSKECENFDDGKLIHFSMVESLKSFLEHIEKMRKEKF